MKSFSDLENRILKVLRRTPKGILISRLSTRVYSKVKDKPLNPNNSIISTITQINKKCIRNNTSWFINGEGSGRNGKRVWIESMWD